MSTTYIAGYDGSRASRAAVRFAAGLAGRTDAHVIAAHVYPSIDPFVLADVTVDREPAMTEWERAGALLERLDEDVTKRPVAGTSVDLALCELAIAKRASLLAVGVTHRGLLGRLIPGGVADRLLDVAPCPVAVVPAGKANGAIEMIAVAYDGQPKARAALATARTLAEHLGARLLLIGVADVGPRVAIALSQAATSLASTLSVETRLLSGPPADAIAQACVDCVDLLVAGSRAHGPIRMALEGSVSRRLVDHARCATLIVPEGTSVELKDSPSLRAPTSAG